MYIEFCIIRPKVLKNSENEKKIRKQITKDLFWGISRSNFLIALIAFSTSLIGFYTALTAENSAKILTGVEEAELVVSGSEIGINSFGPNCPNGEKSSCDQIDPLIKNIGEGRADNIQMELIFCLKEEVVPQHCIRHWNTAYVNELPPASESYFGVSYIPHVFLQNSSTTISLINKELLVLFRLSYLDILSKKNKQNYFFFHYPISQARDPLGKSTITNLIVDDLHSMCPWLIDDLRRATASNEMIQYIKNRCPKPTSILIVD